MKAILVSFTAIMFASCAEHSPSDLVSTGESLQLKWNKAYPDDTIEKSMLGLEWAYSYLGAKLPNSPSGIVASGVHITVYPDQIGLPEQGFVSLKKLHAKILLSDEYQQTGAIDLGRYVSLLIGAPVHYYEIAGVPQHLVDLVANYTLSVNKGYVNNSEVSLVHRKIEFSEPGNLNQIFLASEVDPTTGEVYEFETVEVMPNGQVRFGIFDASGNRKNSTDPEHTNAGKPAKCMWCHESSIQGFFTEQNDFTGYLPFAEFKQKLLDSKQLLHQQRSALPFGVDFAQTQQHTLTELLYISFMEPSAQRLSLEWNLPLATVEQMLGGLQTHVYDEFPFLGNLYHRADIEAIAPFTGLEVSSDVREESEIEVDHINE